MRSRPTKTRAAAAGSEHGSGSVGLLSRQIRHPQDEGQVRKEVWIGDLDTLKKGRHFRRPSFVTTDQDELREAKTWPAPAAVGHEPNTSEAQDHHGPRRG